MTTDLAVPATPNGLAVPPLAGAAQLPGLAAVEEWLTAAGRARQLAELLVRGSFVPDSYKPRSGDPADAWETAVQNATGAILLGQQLAVDPITALQQIVMVKGRPTMYAKFKVALLTAHGHEVWDEEYTADRATVCGRRAGWPTERVVRITITIDQAKRAGWTTNDTYTKTPEDMLWARAASRVCDRVAGDVLFGLPSFADELGQADDREPVVAHVTAEQISRNAERGTALAEVLATAERTDRIPKGREAATAALQQPSTTGTADVSPQVAQASSPAEPDGAGDQAPPDPAPPAEPEPEEAKASGTILAAISARFRELGGRTAGGDGAQVLRRRVIGGMVGHAVERASDLTHAEADLVLNTLQGTTPDLLAQVVENLDRSAGDR